MNHCIVPSFPPTITIMETHAGRQIPQEIVDSIIDHTQHEGWPWTLKRCILTCRAFVPRCRKHLFRSILLTHIECGFIYEKQYAKATALLKMPHIIPLIKELRLVQSLPSICAEKQPKKACNEETASALFWHFLSQLTDVQTLGISTSLSSTHERPERSIFDHSSRLRGLFPNLKRLRISYPVNRLTSVDDFRTFLAPLIPQLSALYFDRPTYSFDGHTYTHYPGVLEEFKGIFESLHLSQCPTSFIEVICDLLQTHPALHCRYLFINECEPDQLGGSQCLESILGLTGHSLQKLTLYLHNIDEDGYPFNVSDAGFVALRKCVKLDTLKIRWQDCLESVGLGSPNGAAEAWDCTIRILAHLTDTTVAFVTLHMPDFEMESDSVGAFVRMDNVLAKMTKLKNISIRTYIPYRWEVLEESPLARRSELLPSLSERGDVSIDVGRANAG